MKCTRAQIQLGESIFVVIIIILLIVFGIVFYAQAQREGISDDVQQFNDLETIAITQYATSLTELECSLQEVQYPNCFDKTKLDAFIQLVDGTGEETAKEFYFSQLGNARLEITQIFPLPVSIDDQVIWLIYDNQPANTASFSQARADIPINIYDPIEDTSAFGTLTIIQYR